MQRDPDLRHLSSDHHHGLVLARRAARAAAADLETAAAAWREVQATFERELEPHFREEEEGLLPALRRAGERALVQRTELEHAALRATVRGDDQPAGRLRHFARLLENHIRFEERILFERAQVTLSRSELQALAYLAVGA